MLHIDYTHIVTQGKQIFIVYVGGRANAVKYGSTLNSVFSVGYFFYFSRSKMIEIGRKLKQYRLQLGLTQEELASRTELTKGYISQLENDLCSPSITTLQDILQVLGVTLEQFFATPKVEKVVYHQNDYFVSQNEGGTNTWLIPNSQVKDIEPIILTLPPKTQCAERLPFEGEEFGYVLQGAIEIVTPTEKYKVKKGESFSINGQKQHLIRNITKSESKVLWVTTPSNF